MAMTRSDLAERVAKKSKMSALQAELVVETIFDCMKSVFLRGERVEVRGLGTFKVRKYKGYRGRNSKTGRSILVAPKRLPVVQSGPCSSRARGPTATIEKQTGDSHVRDGPLVVLTETVEPTQPVRLIWKVQNRAGVLSIFRDLRCVRQDAQHPDRWLWTYEHEAASVGLGKRSDDIPDEEYPILLARISFPSPREMVMRFCAPDRAISAAHFFGPRFGGNAVPDRIRILNRLVTAKEADAGPDHLDGLLDRDVTTIDPAVRMRKLDALLDKAATPSERMAVYERDAAEQRVRDVPEVEDFPLAMEEDGKDLIHLTTALRLRMVRAVERWFGKPTTISGIIYRTFGADSSDPMLRAGLN
jgi:integration host factor subunit beta